MGAHRQITTSRRGFGMIAVTALGLAGCSNAAPGSSQGEGTSGGGGGSSSGGASGGAKADQQTLHLNYGTNKYSAAVLKAFEKQHPNIKVHVTHKDVTFENGSVQTTLRSGVGPDVLLVNSGPGRVGALVQAGLIADLTDVYDNGARKRYPKSVLDQITHSGKIYEVVEGRDIFELHYNKKLFQQAGVTPPKTWDDLLSIGKPLTAAGVQPITVGGADNFSAGWLLGTLVESSAGSATFKKIILGNGSWTQPDVVEAGKKLTALVKGGLINGKNALALKGAQAEANIGHAKAAMMVQTEHMNIDLRQSGIKDTSMFSSIPMPSNNPDNRHPTSGLAVSWIVSTKSPNMAAAQEWIRWVSSSDYLEVAAKNGYIFAPTQLLTKAAKSELDPAIVKAVNDANVEHGYNPSVYLPTSAKTAWYNAAQSLLSNPNQDPKPLFRAINKQLGRSGS